MASTSSEDNTHATAAMATTAVPDSDTTPALRGLPLNDSWSIGERLPRYKQEHATVFLVNDKTGRSVEGLVAYAYVLDKTQPKVRAHRLRNINRMGKRTKLEVRAQDTVIIVVSTSQAPENQASEHSGTADGLAPVEAEPKSNAKLRCKDLYKKEMARTRQRERRQAKRSAKAGKHSNAVADEQERTATSTLDDTTTNPFTRFMIFLFILYDETGTRRGKILAEHYDLIEMMGGERYVLIEMMGGYSLHESLEKFLKQGPAKVESLEDVESYLKAKCAERRTLQRHLAMIPGAEKYHHDKLGAIYREQAQHQKGSEEWQRLEDGPKAQAVLLFRTVAYAKKILPRVVTAQKAQLRSIEKVRARLIKESASVELGERRRRLVNKVVRGEGWTHTVFPESNAYEDILRQVGEAKTELAALDRGLPRGSTIRV